MKKHLIKNIEMEEFNKMSIFANLSFLNESNNDNEKEISLN